MAEVGASDPGVLLLIDKPYRWTSFDVVKKVRNVGKYAKIGHAGTLDPLATGLLILCTGRMTKQIDTFQAQEKEYTGTMVLGKTTPSFDLETEVDGVYETKHITETLLSEGLRQLSGPIGQIPPIYSAVRMNGERLYKKARRGEMIEIQPREVIISAFELTRVAIPEIDFRVVCSKGTYIRSLVRDFGAAVQSGAYLSALRRTRIGAFNVSDALTMESLIESHSKV
jgi:tRNA pseudouridine55 synthase